MVLVKRNVNAFDDNKHIKTWCLWFGIPYYGLNAYILLLQRSLSWFHLNLRVATKPWYIYKCRMDCKTSCCFNFGNYCTLYKNGSCIGYSITIYSVNVFRGLTALLMIGMLILMGVFELKDIRHDSIQY